MRADGHELVYPTFKARFIDTGQVRFVFRNLPTPARGDVPARPRPGAVRGPREFFDVAASLMHGQAAVLRGGTLDAQYAPAIAVSGPTRAQIDACVATPATRAALTP